jgi:hypothetical protein
MGTQFLDVSDPTSIIELGYSVFPAYATNTYDAVPNSDESVIYIARGAGGLRIVDIIGIRDGNLVLATDKRELLVYDDGSNAYRVAIFGRIIFLGTDDGLLILEQI